MPQGVQVRAFQSPKALEPAGGCQDAFSLARHPGWDGGALAMAPERLQVKLADGASSCPFSRDWARLLVCNRLTFPLSDHRRWLRWLPQLARKWRRDLDASLPEDRPYHTDMGLAKGGASTLLRFTFTGLEWTAEAIGDTCLFQVRDGRLLQSFPLARPEDFDRAPALIATLPDRNRNFARSVRTMTGDARPGDTFLLATDALARWLLTRGDAEPLLELGQDPGGWTSLLDLERRVGNLHDDDTTLVMVTLQ